MGKNNKNTTNAAFIILLVLLTVAAFKAQKTPFDLTQMFNAPADFSELSSLESIAPLQSEEKKRSKEADGEPHIVLKDFDTVKPKKVNKTIDRTTALSYTKTRSLSGTEMLELAKVKRISEPMGQDKKIIIYVNKGSDSEIQAFIKEFSKTREKYRSRSNFAFVPLESAWDINDETIANTHDRVIHNLQQDCGLFCIIDTHSQKLIRLKGTTVSKKGAEIVDVILNSL